MEPKILDKNFFNRDTIDVARELIGKYIYRKTSQGIYRAFISETEAYHGIDDLACHCSKGKTNRTKVMFEEPGKMYIYLIYGMYYMLNFVTMPKNFPAAVLIRGVKNLEFQEKNNKIWNKIPKKTDGPGKLTRQLHIDKKLNNLFLTKENGIWLIDNPIKISENDIKISKRIGIEYAGESKNLPWRFYLNKK